MKKAEKIEEQKSKLDSVYKELNTKYGAGTVIAGKDLLEEIEVVSSGSATLDIATSIGGIPIGKLIEIYGPESSGKSTITLHIISEFQKSGKKAVLCDVEQSFDRKYATSIGVDVDALGYVQPECQEDGYNIIETLIRTGEIGLIIIDSHTAMLPRKVVDGEVGEATIALQARINSISLGKIHPLLKDNSCTVIAISQLRTNVGGYGDPNIATGGMAYKFYSDMRLKMSKQVKKEENENRTTVEVVKNKCGIPFRKATFSIEWGVGVDRPQEVIDLAVDNGFLERSGSWYILSEDKKVQGDDKLKIFMSENPKFAEGLEEKVIKKIKND